MKKKIVKKLLCRVMAIVLLTSMIFADMQWMGSGIIDVMAYDNGEIVSGICGDYVQWKLDTGTGVLKITGSGEMYYYFRFANELDSDDDRIENKIKEVIIENGVTSIANEAFELCESLSKIDIPNSVTYIGDKAFEMTNISTISISENITYIGESAFKNIDSLLEIKVSDNNKNYSSKDGNLYNKEGTKFIQYSSGNVRNIFTIPDEVNDIEAGAFSGACNLSEVVIPEGITQIPFDAFAYCTKLSKVNIPSSVKSIGAWAFAGCALNSIVIPESVDSIGAWAFYDAYEANILERIDILNPECEIDTVGEGAFTIQAKEIHGYYGSTAWKYADDYGKKFVKLPGKDVKKITLQTPPDKTQYILGKKFNSEGIKLKIEYDDGTSAVMKYGYTVSGFDSSIPGNCIITIAFEGAIVNYDIEIIEITDNTVETGSLGDSVDWYLNYGTGVLTISGTGDAEYYDGEVYVLEEEIPYIKEIVIEEGVENFETEAAIINKSNILKKITIPKSVEWISGLYCESLEEVIIDEENQNYGVFEGALYTKDKEELIYYLSAGKSEDTFIVSNSVREIDYNAFKDAYNLKNINVEVGNTVYYSENGNLYESYEGDNSLFQYALGKTETKFIVPDNVQDIYQGAFKGNKYLEEVSMPENVESIDLEAFIECENLQKIEILNPQCEFDSFYYNGEFTATIYGFTDSTAEEFAKEYNLSFVGSELDSKWFDSGVCGENVEWKYNKALNTLTIYGDGKMSDSSAEIEDDEDYAYINAFEYYQYQEEIEKIIIEKGVTNIGDYAFKDFEQLSSVEISDTVVRIGKHAFENNCIRELKISDSVTQIESWAFAQSNYIEEVYIPEKIEYIGESAFADCSEVEQFKVNESNKYYCAEERNLYTKDKKTFVQYALRQSKEEFVIPDGVEIIGAGAFYNAANMWGGEIRNITIAKSVTRIKSYAFYGCKYLNNMELPEGLIEIGSYAFYGCEDLDNVNLSKNLEMLGEYAFSYCYKLNSIKIPEKVLEIREGTFDSCDSLKEIEIPKNVEKVEMGQFFNIDAMEKIVILNSNCVLYGDYGWSDTDPIIYGYKGSTAEAYAKQYDKLFVAMDSSDVGEKETTTKKPEVTTKIPETTTKKPETTTKKTVTKVTAPTKAKLTKVKVGKKKVSLTIKKVKGAKGYFIQYATKQNFKGAKKKYTTKRKIAIKKLKSNKKYYFRIKAYTLNGKKKVFSKKWSSVKRVRVK